MTNECTIELEHDEFAMVRFGCAFGAVLLADPATLGAALAALTPTAGEAHANTADWLSFNRWALDACARANQLPNLRTAVAALYALQHHLARA